MIDEKPIAPEPVVQYDAPCPGCGLEVPWESRITGQQGPWKTTVCCGYPLCPTCPDTSEAAA